VKEQNRADRLFGGFDSKPANEILEGEKIEMAFSSGRSGSEITPHGRN